MTIKEKLREIERYRVKLLEAIDEIHPFDIINKKRLQEDLSTLERELEKVDLCEY